MCIQPPKVAAWRPWHLQQSAVVCGCHWAVSCACAPSVSQTAQDLFLYITNYSLVQAQCVWTGPSLLFLAVGHCAFMSVTTRLIDIIVLPDKFETTVHNCSKFMKQYVVRTLSDSWMAKSNVFFPFVYHRTKILSINVRHFFLFFIVATFLN